MNDTPPPTDKKPRRRAAPRKRAPRAKKTAEAATVEVTQTAIAPDAAAADKQDAGVASTTRAAPEPAPAPTVDPSAAAAIPLETEARLDPRPLEESGDRGDAPATDAPAPAPARDDVRNAAAEATPVEAREHPEAPARADSSVTPAPGAADPVAPLASSAAQPMARIEKQASLRPGELIRVPLSVRWRDLDAFNHVNNSKYLSYLEEARLRWMLSVPGMGLDDDVAPVVAASTLNYRRPIEWPGDVVIELFVERLGSSSLTIGHRIVDAKEGGVLYCDGNVVMVWIDRNSGRSAPLPEGVRAACR